MSAELLHNSLIAIHTVAASTSFVSGLMVLTPPVNINAKRGWLFKVFLAAFPFFLIPLFLVIIFDWSQLDISSKFIFPGLSIFDLFMTGRAFEAFQLLKSKPNNWQLKYVDHVGFNIISLFAGFVIVLAIDLGAPIWLVVIIAVLSIAIGIFGVNKVRSRKKIVL